MPAQLDPRLETQGQTSTGRATIALSGSLPAEEQPMSKPRKPAVEGWFTMNEAEPCLIGMRGKETGSVFFPPTGAISADPAAPFEEREAVELSRHGRVWSWTTGNYAPPAPYMTPDPFEPYAVVAVELDEEKMVVLGQLADGFEASDLFLGQEMELVLGTLYEDDEHEYLMWKWRPAEEVAAT